MSYEMFEKLCVNYGVTPYKVAQATGVTTSTLSSWKAGKYIPKSDKIQKLADYFGVPVSAFIEGEEADNASVSYIMTPKPQEDSTARLMAYYTALTQRHDLQELVGVAQQLPPDDVQLLISLSRRFGRYIKYAQNIAAIKDES